VSDLFKIKLELNLEIILVDDGSYDSCPAICDAFAAEDSRIVILCTTML